MSYFITGSNLLTRYVNTSGTSPVDVTPEVQGRACVIASVEVTDIGGGTGNLTIDIYDPDTPATYFKRNALAPFWLPPNWRLRVTLSAGTASVLVNYFNPNATGQR